MIFIFLLVMPKYEGKQNVSIDIVREKERQRNTPGTRVFWDVRLVGELEVNNTIIHKTSSLGIN